ncbi:MAG TPA: hypothetical protein VF062_14415 [Candidatus Limnocylindrales bacterium]
MSSTRPSGTGPARTLRRLATVAALGALVGLPLAALPASATDPASVTFSGGGLGLLLCGSKPDTSRITVPAEQRVRLTNNLGLNATLNIDGSANSTVANGETVEVQFHRGPVAIGMVPDCALNLNPKFEQLTVEVSTPAAAAPAPARSTSAAAAPRPSPSKPSAAGAAAAAGSARGGQDGSPPVPPAPGDPLFSEPAVPGVDPSAGVNLESPATVVHAGRSPQGQKLAGSTGPVDKGPIGLLAIIATVCVVGVSVGAIRAIITQRATRAEFA